MNTDDRTRLMRFICSNRPTWNEAGVADAIKTVELRYPADNFRVAIHCLTQAAKASNEKPIAMTWDLPEQTHEPVRRPSDEPHCATHPKSGYRPNGECAGCVIDRDLEKREQAPERPVFEPRPLPSNRDELLRMAGLALVGEGTEK